MLQTRASNKTSTIWHVSVLRWLRIARGKGLGFGREHAPMMSMNLIGCTIGHIVASFFVIIIIAIDKIRSPNHRNDILSSVIESRSILDQLVPILLHPRVQLGVFSNVHQDVVQGLIVLHKLRNFKGLVRVQSVLFLYRIGGLQDDCLAEYFYLSDVFVLQLENSLLGRRRKELDGLKVYR